MSFVTPMGVNVGSRLDNTDFTTSKSLLATTSSSQQQQQQPALPVASAAAPVSSSLSTAAFSSLVAFAMPETAEGLLTMAKMAEVCERWDEMLVCMKRLAKLSSLEEDFGSEERNLLHVAYKNCVLTRRASWRVAKSAEQQTEMEVHMMMSSNGGNKNQPGSNALGLTNQQQALMNNILGSNNGSADIASLGNANLMQQKQGALTVAQEFRVQLENEIADICTDMILLVENVLFPDAIGDDAKMFLYKVAGDFYRYLAEVNPSGTFASTLNSKSTTTAAAPTMPAALLTASNSKTASKFGAHAFGAAGLGSDNGKNILQQQLDEYWVLAQEAYAKAEELASALRPSHPMRLAVALNLAIFYYETMRSPEKALHLARQAFTAAIGDETPPETILDSEVNEAGAILQLLQENLYFWTNPSGNNSLGSS